MTNLKISKMSDFERHFAQIRWKIRSKIYNFF